MADRVNSRPCLTLREARPVPLLKGFSLGRPLKWNQTCNKHKRDVRAERPMKIRPACPEELDTLHDIVRAATRDMDRQGILQWDETYPNREILSKDLERHELYVIEVEGQVTGLVAKNDDQSPEYAAVQWLYPGRALVVHRLTIHPACQRNGLAARLMDFVEEMAAAEGYDCIRLDAFTRNRAAFTLYENRGYRRAGIVRFRKGEFYCYEKPIKA